MQLWPIKRRVGDLIRQVHRSSAGPEPHQLRQAVEDTVWGYIDSSVPDRKVAALLMCQVFETFDRLPSPSALSYFTMRETKRTQRAPGDLHRLLASWLMALVWEGLRDE